MQLPIETPRELNIETFESVLNQIMRNISNERGIIIDLSNVEKVKLGGLLNLLALGGALKERKLRKKEEKIEADFVQLILPNEKKVKNYLHQMQLVAVSSIIDNCFINDEELAKEDAKKKKWWNKEKALWKEGKVDEGRFPFYPIHYIPKIDSFYPYAKIPGIFESQMRKFINDIQDVFCPTLKSILKFPEKAISGFKKQNGDLVAAFWQPNKELYENIYRHSSSWGAIAIQTYPDRVVMSYVDIGLGLRETLGQRYDVKTDGEAIIKALEEGSSRSENSPGNGLPIVKRYVEEWNGKLVIRSGETRFITSKNQNSFKKVSFFPGTQIHISIPAHKNWRNEKY